MVATTLTSAQYQQLLHLLKTQPSDSDESLDAPTNNGATALLASTFCLLANNTHSWIIDSGASDHMTFDLNLFESYHPLQHNEHTITIPDGRHIAVKCIGTISLPSGIKLKNVLYVPQFRFNLISTHRLCQDLNCDVIFNSNGCFVQDLSMREPWLLGKVKQGLYYVDNLLDAFSGSTPNKTHPRTGYITAHETCSSSHIASTDMHHKAKLWHLRLGHTFSQTQVAFSC